MGFADWSAWKTHRQKAPALVQVPLCADGPALLALEEAKTAAFTAEARVGFFQAQHKVAPSAAAKKKVTAAKTVATKAAKAVTAAEKAVAEYTMLITVQPMPPQEYRDLKDEHRPTDPAKLAKGDEWEEATFAPALIAASLTPDQPVTPDDVPDLWGTVTLAERSIVFLTCYSLNETVPDLGFIEPDIAQMAGIGQS